MFVEFSVSNYKSIAYKVTFSANASVSSSKRKDISTETGSSIAPHLLKCAVAFGPNAAGKSSLINALNFFQGFAVNSSSKHTDGDKIHFPRNKIISRFKDEPSEFEIVFIHDGELYQFGFCVDNDKVYEEWLYARKSKASSKTRLLYHRNLLPNSDDEYDWVINDAQLPGEKDTWKKATRSNALFLSTAVQLNSDTLSKPFDWIKNYLHIIGANDRVDHDFTAQLLEDDIHTEKVENFIKSFDLHIDGFRVESKPFVIPDAAKEMLSSSMLEEFSQLSKNQKSYNIFTKHRNDADEIIELKLYNESDGTQALFGLAGPFLDVIENGYTLFVDELSNSLHPHALKKIVDIFQNNENNDRGAQLFFTSHETSIISKDFMHKDQIWFIDKPDGLSTKLSPLSDFNIRDVEAFQRSYLGGKFGALPNIKGV